MNDTTTTAAVMASGSTEQPARSSVVVKMHPELLMAACSGDHPQLGVLLDRSVGDARPPPAVVVEVDVDRSSSVSSAPSDLLAGVTSQGDSALHVMAANGDGEEFVESATLIYRRASSLLDAPNKRGDTPLHCAARAGKAKMVRHLIALARGEDAGGDGERVKIALRKQNEQGETVLHEVIRCAHGDRDLVGVLLAEDSELARIPREGTSPLYVAIQLGRTKIAKMLYDRDVGLSCSGPGGRNALHVGVLRDQVMTKWLLDWNKDLAKQADQHGSTPLHLLVASSSSRGSGQAISLLEANPSSAYQPDNNGSFPIHIAASNGNLKAVKILLERCPNCVTLRDGQGSTFLHIAVKEKRSSIVAYACSYVNSERTGPILNIQDDNGDTALHLAVRVGILSTFNYLLRIQQVRLDLTNKDGLTPQDLAWRMIPGLFYFGSNPRSVILRTLKHAHAPTGDRQPDDLRAEYAIERDDDRESQNMTNATQVMGIASVLVATVTFAAAFTLPGGYRADDRANGGTPTLTGIYTFDAFVVAISLAFICSLFATVGLIYAGVSAMDLSIRRPYFDRSLLLLHSSVTSLAAAFALGLYAVLASVAHKTAAVVCVIVFASFLYGNTEVRQVFVSANTLRVRLGCSAAGFLVIPLFSTLLLKFWSYAIIFGLPAIFKACHTE